MERVSSVNRLTQGQGITPDGKVEPDGFFVYDKAVPGLPGIFVPME